MYNKYHTANNARVAGLLRRVRPAGWAAFASAVFLYGNAGAAASNPVNVTANRAPVAHAGLGHTVAIGERIVLDGSASSDADGQKLQYHWRLTGRPAGSTARVEDEWRPWAYVTADKAGDYTAELVVSDGIASSLPAAVSYSTSNSAPVALPGLDRRVEVGETVLLDGQQSADSDKDTLRFSWRLLEHPADSQTAVVRAGKANPQLAIDAEGDYRVELVVSDGRAKSKPAVIRLSTDTMDPLAAAGSPQTVPVGHWVTLNGNGSRGADGGALNYAWAILHTPSGSTAQLLRDDTPQPRFLPDVAGHYIAQLIVADSRGAGRPDTVVIEVLPAGHEAVAMRATPQGGLPDTDGDGVPDLQDNCLLTANANQRDTNGDGFGNACDPDLNNDGAINFLDLAIMKSVFFGSNPDADLNGDGSVNFLDLGIMKARFFGAPGPTGFVRWVNMAGGDWNTASNWFPVGLPQPESNVIININANITVTHSEGSTVINQLISQNRLNISGGTFRVLTTMQVNDVLTLSGSATLQDAHILAPVSRGGQPASVVIAGANSAIFDAVTLSADLTVDTNGSLQVQNGLTLNGSTVRLVDAQLYFTTWNATLGGTGTVQFDGTSDFTGYIYGYGLTVGPNIVIRSGASGGYLGFQGWELTVQGTVVSNLPGGTVYIAGTPLIIEGSIQSSNGGNVSLEGTWTLAASGSIAASGGQLILNGSWSNLGSIDAADAQVLLRGTVTLANLADLEITGSSVVVLEGTLDNTGQTLNISTLPWVFQLENWATILGGSIAGPPLVVPVGLILDGVTLSTNLTVDTNANLYVQNGLTLNGSTVRLVDAQLYFTTSNATLGGAGTVQFDGTSGGRVYGFELTVGPNIVIRSGASGGYVGIQGWGLTVQGAVVSNLPGGTVYIAGTPLTIEGSIQSSNGGNVALDGTWTLAASGSIAASGGQLFLNGSWSNLGSIAASGGQLILHGSWSNLGSFDAANAQVLLRGTVNLASLSELAITGSSVVVLEGTLDNTGQTLNISTLPWAFQLENWATILGGTIAGPPLVVPGGLILDGVTLSTNLTVDTNANLYVQNGLTLNGSTVRLVDAQLYFTTSNATLGGAGTVQFDGTSGGRVYGFELTVGPNIVIRSGASGGYVGIQGWGLTVQGAVVSNLPAHPLWVAGTPFTNQNIFAVAAGAEINVQSDYTQTTAGRINVEIGGTNVSQFGRVIVDPAYGANLAGTLGIVLVNGFTPALNDIFDVMTFGSRTGVFAVLDGANLGGGLMFQANYTATRVRLRVVAAN